MHLDSHAGIIGIEAQVMNASDLNVTAIGPSVSDRMMTHCEQELIILLHNSDLDPISSLNFPVQETVKAIEVTESLSVASSITFGDDDNSDSNSNATRQANNTMSSIASQSTLAFTLYKHSTKCY